MGAQLQEVVLEGAELNDADFTGADLSKANLAQTRCTGCCFHAANRSGVRAEKTLFEKGVFIGTDLTGAVSSDSVMTHCDFTNARYDTTQFATTDMARSKGLAAIVRFDRNMLEPVVQLGSSTRVYSVAC